MSFELRYYQKEAIQSVFKNIVDGNRLLCLVLATGAGKTVVFSNIAKKVIEKNKKVLVLAHRTELLYQAKNTLHKIIGEDCKIQIEQGVDIADSDSNIIIASVQTLGRTGSERIKKLDPKDFGLIIVDECFDGKTKILLEDGTEKKISEIVKNKLESSVISELNGKKIISKVYDWFKIKGKRDGVLIKTRFSEGKIKCTNNHKFDTLNKGKVEAKYLEVGDFLFRYIKNKRFGICPILTEEQIDVFIGSMLGDGSFNNRGGLDRFNFSCVNEQYFNFKANILRNIGIRTKTMKSGYTGREDILKFISRTSYEFTSIYKNVFSVKKISWLCLAIWYLDDGSISNGVMRINSNSFTYKENLYLAGLLNNQGIRCRVGTEKKLNGKVFYHIQLFRDSTKLVSYNIRKFVVPSMYYKILEEDRFFYENIEVEYNVFGIDKIQSIEEVVLNEVYNISVENSHKYIANGISTYNCHHLTSSTYQNILTHFGANKQTGLVEGHPVVLGVTATPTRADNVGLDKNLDIIAYSYDMQRAINDGFLSPIRAFTVFTDTDISGVKSSMGDFSISELSDTVNNPERNLQILETYLKKCNGEPTIIFAVDVKHAIDLTDTFNNGNIQAKYVTGAFKKELRDSILQEFKRGEFNVIINIGVFTEGFDEPKISSVFLARPTKSAGLHCQMIGRGTRLFQGKEHCKIFDFVDNTKNNRIVTCASLIGIGQVIKADDTDIFEIKDKIEELLLNKPGVNLRELDLEKIEEKIAEVDIFAAAALDSFVKENSKYSWTTFLGGYKISLGENEEGEKAFIEIRENAIGGYDCSIIKLKNQIPTFENEYKKFSKEVKAGFSVKDKKLALELGDKIITDNFSDKVNLVSQNAKWKKEPPTEKQIFILKKHGYSNAESLTKGQANQLISKIFSEKF